MRRRLFIAAVAAIALLAVLAPSAKRYISRTFPYWTAHYAGLARNFMWSWTAVPGAATTEANPAHMGAFGSSGFGFSGASVKLQQLFRIQGLSPLP